jgi:hypothetical protein
MNQKTELEKKYRVINWLIIVLLVWFALTYTLNNVAMLIEENAPVSLALLGLILPILAIIFTFKYKLWIYYVIAVFSLILIIQGLIAGYPLGIIPLVLLTIFSIMMGIKLQRK